MAQLREILNHGDNLLEAHRFKDYCPNGLQVEGKHEVNHVVTGVSASLELFQRANDIGGDLILVHHGLLWQSGIPIISGSFKRRLKYLL
ncbi:MAG: Nif3-like dinuclear metal center hexameric protein, partial [Spirochaetota bacterium]|nr:Nif3-like dinuclear metal center hexameric protein [Spirochaetota bacterium]